MGGKCNIQYIVSAALYRRSVRSVGLYANNKLTTKGLAVSLLHVL